MIVRGSRATEKMTWLDAYDPLTLLLPTDSRQFCDYLVGPEQSASLKAVDFVAQRIDIGVRYGAGNWPGLAAEKLMDEEVYPVCSPRLLVEPGRLMIPADLIRETLIDDLSMDRHSGFPTWEAWLARAGVEASPKKRGMQINNSAAVLQAAIDGHGAALAR
jgi:LysR family transcriptional regulator, glycine cleavage system transcriptional activator